MTNPNRRCRRKHWRAWRLKQLDDHTQLVECPICGSDATTNIPGTPEHQAHLEGRPKTKTRSPQ